MSYKVLLIEPDSILKKTYQVALESAGFLVTPTTSAQEAIMAMDKQTPDLTILEPQLVKHGGMEFLYEMRSYPEWQHVPTLLHTFISAGQLRNMQDSLNHLGVVSYLYKPQTTLQQLVSACRDFSMKTQQVSR